MSDRRSSRLGYFIGFYVIAPTLLALVIAAVVVIAVRLFEAVL